MTLDKIKENTTYCPEDLQSFTAQWKLIFRVLGYFIHTEVSPLIFRQSEVLSEKNECDLHINVVNQIRDDSTEMVKNVAQLHRRSSNPQGASLADTIQF